MTTDIDIPIFKAESLFSHVNIGNDVIIYGLNQPIKGGRKLPRIFTGLFQHIRVFLFRRWLWDEPSEIRVILGIEANGKNNEKVYI